jgi:hypothetical protein
LRGQEDRKSVRIASRSRACDAERHHGDEAEYFWLTRDHLTEQSTEAERLGLEIEPHERAGSTRVPFVEDRVDDAERGADAFGKLLRIGQRVRAAISLDRLLRAENAPRDDALRTDERAWDLLRRESSDHLQREGDLIVREEPRMTAREDGPKVVVA